MNVSNLRALLAYERSPNRTRKAPKNDRTLEDRIRITLDKQAPLPAPLTVWRGQRNCTITPTSWFSTSTRNVVSRSYGGRCLFKIHLQPGVRCLDLYATFAKFGIQNPYTEPNKVRNLLENNTLNISNNYSEFKEVIVEEGGSFWKDAEQREAGFRHIGSVYATSVYFEENEAQQMNVYETFYFPPSPN